MNTQVRVFHFQQGEKNRHARPINLRMALATIKRWHARYKQRRQLSQLPAEMLKDIGVSRTDALIEANKPFWKG